MKVHCKLILCIVRHLGGANALKMVTDLYNNIYFNKDFVAVGLGGIESKYPPHMFVEAYKVARLAGLNASAHCGEETGSDFIKDGLLYLSIDRIDHGCSMVKDPVLMDHIIYRNIKVTSCPVSNIKIGLYKKMEDHPIKEMLDKGVCVSINSDDPSYFNAELVDNYIAVADAFNLTEKDILQLALNSFECGFLPCAELLGYWEEIRYTYNIIVRDLA